MSRYGNPKFGSTCSESALSTCFAILHITSHKRFVFFLTRLRLFCYLIHLSPSDKVLFPECSSQSTTHWHRISKFRCLNMLNCPVAALTRIWPLYYNRCSETSVKLLSRIELDILKWSNMKQNCEFKQISIKGTMLGVDPMCTSLLIFHEVLVAGWS